MVRFPHKPGFYAPGHVVAVPVMTRVGAVSHKGILSDRAGYDGWPMVIHNSKLYERVMEAPMGNFFFRAAGPMHSEGYLGSLPVEEVLERARKEIGQPWRLWSNCEHFVHHAHGLSRKSPQIRESAKKGSALAGLAAFGYLVVRMGGV